uniref:Linker for activation of T cells family member 2 n=1 Tax=Capra hircus TaxID=9925 RepID=A0A8C2RN93_CAPHI
MVSKPRQGQVAPSDEWLSPHVWSEACPGQHGRRLGLDLSSHLALGGGIREMANLVLLLQVQRSLRKSMSRGVLVREAWPGDTASNMELTRKDKLLRFSPSLEDSSSPRYQYFSKGSRPRSEESYIDPTSTDYYNCDPFQKPVEDDDDTNSYENVLICKPKRMDSGDEGSEDYQNSASIQQWRESKRVVEPAPREAPLSLAGSPDEDGEPDYVNGDVAATEA